MEDGGLFCKEICFATRKTLFYNSLPDKEGTCYQIR